MACIATADRAEMLLRDSPRAAIGSAAWNDRMYRAHPTPYTGLAGIIERARLGWIRRWVGALAPRSILDVGCGEGVLLDAFGEDVDIVGVDLSIDSLRVCRGRHASRSVIQADGVRGLPLRDHAFDLVICTEVMEHIPEPGKLVSELRRICAADGHVLLTVPIERPKLIAKAVLKRTPLFGLLFPGIEPGFSAWHLHDFDLGTLESLIDGKFEIVSSHRNWGLHRCLLLRPCR